MLVLKEMNYYFLNYIYIWIPLIIILLYLAYRWDKRQAKKISQRRKKYIIKIIQKNGMNQTYTIVTNEKDYEFRTSGENPKLMKRYHVTPSSCFECDKENFEPLYNNWLIWCLKPSSSVTRSISPQWFDYLIRYISCV